MSIPLEILPATVDQKPILAHLIEFYIYDSTAYSGRDVNADGRFGYRYLDHYWEEAERFAYLFRFQNKWAGFGLITGHVYLPENSHGHSIAEFFVMRKYRRTGIGRIAFRRLIALHPGRWEIRVERENQAGIAFWPVVIAELTTNNYQRIELDPTSWDGPIYSFDYPMGAKTPQDR